jgi:hypothetical protein
MIGYCCFSIFGVFFVSEEWGVGMGVLGSTKISGDIFLGSFLFDFFSCLYVSEVFL